MLGRCRRSVLVCDSGKPRNARSTGLHGYLTRDGIAPSELLRIGKEEVARYPSVEFHGDEVTDVRRTSVGFTVVCLGGREFEARKLLLATGVVDELPEVDGLPELYGRSVHHCPYCDGWEWRGHPLAVYGRGDTGSALALGLTVWSDDVVLCTDGPEGLSADEEDKLAAAGVGVREEPIARLEGRAGMLERVVFADGESLPRRALFFASGQHQKSHLAQKLGARFNEKGTVETGSCESTNVPGLFVAGDSSKEAQFVIVAAAEGAEAAMAINKALLKDDLLRRETPARAVPAGAVHTRKAAE